jgi:hypothetical protein
LGNPKSTELKPPRDNAPFGGFFVLQNFIKSGSRTCESDIFQINVSLNVQGNIIKFWDSNLQIKHFLVSNQWEISSNLLLR